MESTLKNTGYARIYPSLTSKIRQRLSDIPWKLSELRDSIFPSEFAQLHNIVRSSTMVGYPRLRGLYRAVKYTVTQNIKGDVVECGTARGGSAALLGLTLKQLRSNRTLWVFDSFAGLPAPTKDDPDYEIAKQYTGTCRGELEEVRKLFDECGILAQSRFVKGLFQDTVPASEMEAISVLHIDGDWYESVKVCLENLYDRVSPGGVIQIDDYGCWAGASKAVNEFFRQRSIHTPLRYLDYGGRQFVKPLKDN